MINRIFDWMIATAITVLCVLMLIMATAAFVDLMVD
jgi:hypothetical protein